MSIMLKSSSQCFAWGQGFEGEQGFCKMTLSLRGRAKVEADSNYTSQFSLIIIIYVTMSL